MRVKTKMHRRINQDMRQSNSIQKGIILRTPLSIINGYLLREILIYANGSDTSASNKMEMSIDQKTDVNHTIVDQTSKAGNVNNIFKSQSDRKSRQTPKDRKINRDYHFV